MEQQDITRKCVDVDRCGGKEFVITAGEKEFFEGKGYPLPKRCQECRVVRKRLKNSPFGKVAEELRRKNGGKR